MAFFEQGLVHLYTGNGKGKTTAALGLALRASGHGARVGVVQFLKGWDFYGEIAGLAFLPGVELVRTGRAEYVHKEAPLPEDFSEAQRGLKIAQSWLQDGLHDLVIMDEINVAVAYSLLSETMVQQTLASRIPSVEVVLTGRYASDALRALADLITIMEEIRHPYASGIPAHKGREY